MKQKWKMTTETVNIQTVNHFSLNKYQLSLQMLYMLVLQSDVCLPVSVIFQLLTIILTG